MYLLVLLIQYKATIKPLIDLDFATPKQSLCDTRRWERNTNKKEKKNRYPLAHSLWR